MRFSEIEKEASPGQIPLEIGDFIREKAARERASLSAVMTELLCKSIGRDPSEFGLEARRSVRMPQQTAAV